MVGPPLVAVAQVVVLWRTHHLGQALACPTYISMLRFCTMLRRLCNCNKRRFYFPMVGVRGFEPPTPASRRQCSTKLSYTPIGSITIAHNEMLYDANPHVISLAIVAFHGNGGDVFITPSNTVACACLAMLLRSFPRGVMGGPKQMKASVDFCFNS